MKRRGYNRPPKTPPKDRRTLRERLDEAERVETQDWIYDLKELEWKRSEDYARREQLAETFAKRKHSPRRKGF